MKGNQLNFFGYDKDKGFGNSRPRITLTLDALILLSVVLVLLLVISFSLGVGRGRKIALKGLEKETTQEETLLAFTSVPKQGAVEVVKPEPKEPEETEKISVKEVNKPKQRTARVETIEPPKVKASSKDSGKRYLIQVASYLTKDKAQEEANKLEGNGFPTKIEKKGKYVVIFVGEFNNRTVAEENMQQLRKVYHDCFIRRL